MSNCQNCDIQKCVKKMHSLQDSVIGLALKAQEAERFIPTDETTRTSYNAFLERLDAMMDITNGYIQNARDALMQASSDLGTSPSL